MKPAHEPGPGFFPREHGATAMLLTPFIAAAILVKQVYWPELVAFVLIAGAFAIKEPLVVIARQRFVWKQQHAETAPAKRFALIDAALLSIGGAILLLTRDWRPFMPLFFGAVSFTILAVTLTVRNQQRSEWFQVASAIALSATSLTACLAAKGEIPDWGWQLWLLCALQASAGIFVVHARLDARIAAKRGGTAPTENRRAAYVCLTVLAITAAWFASARHIWISVALLLAATGYLADLIRQKNPAALQMPLKRVGLQALGLSIAYALLLVVGLWQA